MDDNTLNSLQQAFSAAPSSQLATVIISQLVEREKYTDIHVYVEHLDAEMPPEEFSTIARALMRTNDKNILSSFLLKSGYADVPALIEVLTKEGKPQQAEMLYDCMLGIDESCRTDTLDTLTGKAKPVIDIEKKAKLRVIEKVDFNKVTDLNRYAQETTDFKDVVGLDRIKKQIHKKIIMPFQKPSLFERFKKKIGGGVLLYGPPGCGKTLLARATAGECNAQFYNIEISDVMDMYIGESEQKLHAIFEKARESIPSVIFFDEMEALAGKREHSRHSSSTNVVSQFLAELDGFSQANKGVLILASTNVPWAIDPAFLRPGRFDRMFFVPPPDKVARQAILQHHAKDRPMDTNIDFTALAAKTTGYSGADLANLVEMAADEAIDDTLLSEDDVNISTTHFKDALQESRATTTEWLTTARNYARYANDGGRYDDVIDFLKKHGK